MKGYEPMNEHIWPETNQKMFKGKLLKNKKKLFQYYYNESNTKSFYSRPKRKLNVKKTSRLKEKTKKNYPKC